MICNQVIYNVLIDIIVMEKWNIRVKIINIKKWDVSNNVYVYIMLWLVLLYPCTALGMFGINTRSTVCVFKRWRIVDNLACTQSCYLYLYISTVSAVDNILPAFHFNIYFISSYHKKRIIFFNKVALLEKSLIYLIPCISQEVNTRYNIWNPPALKFIYKLCNM